MIAACVANWLTPATRMRSATEGESTTLALHEYIDAQRKNLEAALKFELFGATCPRMDRLYELSIAAVPKDKSPVFGQFLLICHKSFLAAATLIGQAQPDDAGPITRRAIEVVRLAAAIRADPAVAEEWGAYEKRMARWEARNEGETPKALHVRIPAEHPLVKQLMDVWGIISDADAHFTPEFFHSLRWEKRDDKMFLHYFSGEQRTIETAIIHLLGAHMMMLRIFDECLGGALAANDEWMRVRDEIFAVAKPYADKLERGSALGTPEAES